jgi:vanillate O-demethylase monooxygenase subunit
MKRYLQHTWYAAAWADELAGDKLLSRTIAEEPLLFWIDEQGKPKALADRCPHRHLPLSLGQRVPGGIRCAYHGLEFNGDGGCIHNPHGPVVSALCVRAYPALERHKIIWVWMGAISGADASMIPDLGFVDSTPLTAFNKGYLPTAAGHRLLEDNILDLSHADFLHPHTLGGGSITRSKATVEARENNTLFVQWLANNEIGLPIFRSEFSPPDQLTDMWTSVLWHPNGVMVLRAGATAAGRPWSEGIDTWNAHIMTPETEHSTHYFHCNSRTFRVEDAEYNAHLAAGLRMAFATEDKPVVEAQQRRLGERDLFDLTPVLLPTDVGSTRARRIYQRLLVAENTAPESA